MDMETRYHRGLVLWRLGRFEDSQATLLRALADQEQALVEDPEGSADYLRISGKILFALRRHPEAIAAYRRALEIDRRRLAASADPEEMALILWSLGRTQLASGDVESAMLTLAKARKTTPYRDTQEDIRRWLRREVSRGDVFGDLTMAPAS
jgi:tetratricopeptide (TPR) repeat protein